MRHHSRAPKSRPIPEGHVRLNARELLRTYRMAGGWRHAIRKLLPMTLSEEEIWKYAQDVCYEGDGSYVHLSPSMRIGAATHLTQRRYIDILWKHATSDGLTGILNRNGWARGVIDRLKQVERDLEGFKKGQNPYMPVFVLTYDDLNAFKQLNDSCGHSEGDSVLIKVAEALDTKKKPWDIVARLGGDEFGAAFVGNSTFKPVEYALRTRWAIKSSIESLNEDTSSHPQFDFMDGVKSNVSSDTAKVGISTGIIQVTGDGIAYLLSTANALRKSRNQQELYTRLMALMTTLGDSAMYAAKQAHIPDPQNLDTFKERIAVITFTKNDLESIVDIDGSLRAARLLKIPIQVYNSFGHSVGSLPLDAGAASIDVDGYLSGDKKHVRWKK